MWHATSQNKKSIKDYEEEILNRIDDIDDEEKIKPTKQDVLAMIIAGFQVIFPIVLIGAGSLFLLTLFFTKIFLR
ncbi:hypothetical protein CLPU_13c00180 [Gottschalkia purinilytica]|uniref:Uncharacterized protein n=1 Tax=Gottschalkia purinilytica TaxID=1503 RepID=A0A0L0W8A3_GOTPU|nr:hypothetical protein [Gottschalkia purinilytica]KNF07676.1 hypothetical protein CLPU_13c00180 [Gottschalkia purinilytica]